MDYSEFEGEMGQLENAIRGSRKKRILVFVHGGLTSLTKGHKSSAKIAKSILSERSDVYPVFINWNTEFFSTYGRHLIADQAGVSYNDTQWATKLGRAAMSPLNAFGDLGSGLANLPANSVRATYRLMARGALIANRFPGTFPEQYSYSTRLKNGLRLSYMPGDGSEKGYDGFSRQYSRSRTDFSFNIGLGNDLVTLPISEREIMTTLWSPVKNATLIPAAGMGRGAWDNMILRARLLVHGHREFFVTYPPRASQLSRQGPGLILVDRLNKLAKRHHLKLDLYGHSMGTHVLNGIIDDLARPGAEHQLNVDKVVYLAAACRINDFRRTAGRYIEKTKTPFYNLCLHPTQEVRESYWNDFAGPIIAGSLLTWIDSMFERPPSFGDRTLGTFMNAVLAEGLLPKGNHVTLKGFGADFQKGRMFFRDRDSDLGPQKHGEFNEYKFWRDEYLNPAVQTGFRHLLIEDE